jgi:dephospho-CoA kinase
MSRNDPHRSRMASPRRRPQGRPEKSSRGRWKHGAIPVLGLVGGIGSGKSAAAAEFEKLGAFVIDADKVGHALLDQRPVLERVASRFGPGVLLPVSEGEPPKVDRRALGARVFANPAALADLETILHPRMRRTFEKAIARTVRRGGSKAVVLDAAVLFEAGWDSLCDRVVFVDTPREQRLARVAEWRGWDDATLASREAAQWPLDRKSACCDAVVKNVAGLDSLGEEVGRVWKSVLARPSPPRKKDVGPGGAETDR